jgi:hypothetical protein
MVVMIHTRMIGKEIKFVMTSIEVIIIDVIEK